MDNRSKSILLQVAFKAAVETGVPNEEQTRSFYELLTSLHDKLGINVEDSAPRRSYGGGGASTPPKPKPEGAVMFMFEGASWYDYRPAKANGSVVKGHPDFKSVDNKQSKWLYDQEGAPNADTALIVAAADAEPF